MEKYLYLKPFTIKLPWIGKRILCQFKVGDKVKCKYGNSGNKFWSDLLSPSAIIKKIKYNERAQMYKLGFAYKGSIEYFYENDFEKVEDYAFIYRDI